MRASPLILAVIVAAGGCGKKGPPPAGDAGSGGVAGVGGVSGGEAEVPLPPRDPAAEARRTARLAEFRAAEAKVAAALRARPGKGDSPSPGRVATVRLGEGSFTPTAAYVSPADPGRVCVRMTQGKAARYVVHDLLTGTAVARFDAPWSLLMYSAYSPDGAAFAVGGTDTPVTVWDTKTGQVRKQFPTTKPVWALAYAPDGSLVVSVGGSLVQFDPDTGEARRTFAATGTNTSRQAVSPDGKVLAAVTTTRNNRVGLWDVATGARHPSPAAPDQAVQQLTFTPDGRTLLMVRMDKVVTRDLTTGAEKTLATGDAPALSPDGKLLAYRGDRNTRVRDLGSGAEHDLGPVSIGSGDPFFFPGGSLLGGVGNGVLTIWDVEAIRPK